MLPLGPHQDLNKQIAMGICYAMHENDHEKFIKLASRWLEINNAEFPEYFDLPTYLNNLILEANGLSDLTQEQPKHFC